MTQVVALTDHEQQCLSHLNRARQQGKSLRAYADEQGLKVGSLYHRSCRRLGGRPDRRAHWHRYDAGRRRTLVAMTSFALGQDLASSPQPPSIRRAPALNFLSVITRIDENTEKKKQVYREYDDGKNMLRKAMYDLIPENIINRKKQGFSAPDESWYRGENAAYVRELLLNGKTASSEFINPSYIQKIVKEHTNQHINHRLLIWSLMNFE